MHSTDALYLKTPCHLPLGINQFHRGKTQLSSWAQLLLDRIHVSCVGCFHLWNIQKNMGHLSGHINLNWMSSSICLIPSYCWIWCGVHEWLGSLYCTQTCSLHFKNNQIALDISKHRCTIKKKVLKKRNNFIQIACHQQHNTPGLFTSWDVPCRTLLTKCLSENAMYKKKKEAFINREKAEMAAKMDTKTICTG